MKLRHKKPLNSYKGQANNDKNEFNDDDFRQQGSEHKKVKYGYIQTGNPPNEHIFKYARILTKFVKTINQDYRQAEGRSTTPALPSAPEGPRLKEKTQIDLERESPHPRRQELKQQKYIPKLQAKNQPKQDIRDTKLPSKKKDNAQISTPLKDTRNTASNGPSAVQSGPTFQQTFTRPKSQLKNKEGGKPPSNRIDFNKSQNETIDFNRGATVKNPAAPANGSDSNGAMFGMGVNQQMNMGNFMNMGQNMGGNMGNMMGQNAMFGGMNMMNMNGLNGMNQMELAQFLMRYNGGQNFPMFGGFPMNMNMGMMGVNMNMPGGSQFGLQAARNHQPVANLFNEQVSSFKTIKNDNSSKDAKTVYPLKRSAYHVAISYKIYLDKLKREGRNFDNLDDIDPTKSARRVKSNQQGRSGNASNRKK